MLRGVRYGNHRMCCVGSLFGAANADEVASRNRPTGEQDKADACGKLGDEELLGPEVVFDPGCHAPGRFVGTSRPARRRAVAARALEKHNRGDHGAVPRAGQP